MRRTTGLVALLASAGLLLTACGGDDSGEESTTVTTDSGITVEGAAGEAPTVTTPDEDPPTELVVETLEEGDGDEVGADDFVVANYHGQTWEPLESAPDEPNVFDTSFSEDRGPTGFSLNSVIPGWKEGLAGQKVGSRVVLTIPPDQGYGEQGSGETIPANSTLAFVVEIEKAIPANGSAHGEAANEAPAGLPTVTDGGEGKAPTLDFAGAKAPEKSSSTLLIQGDGDKVGDNVAVNMVQASYPDGADAQNTWDLKQLQGLPVETFAQFPGGLGDIMAEATVGSRVMVALSGADNPGQDGKPGTPMVMVLDIVDTY